MSAGMLYQAMGLHGYREVWLMRQECGSLIRLEQPPESLRCSHCGSAQVHDTGRVRRRFRNVPIGKEPMWLELHVARIWCQPCSHERRVRFAEPLRRQTRTFERLVAELSGKGATHVKLTRSRESTSSLGS